jgi:hypothetical protein
MLNPPQVTYMMLWFTANAILQDVRKLVPELEFRDDTEIDEIRDRWIKLIGEFMQINPCVWMVSREERERKEKLEREVAAELGIEPQSKRDAEAGQS